MKALWNWQRNSKFNRASRAGKQRHRENVPTDEEGDVLTIHGPLTARNEHMTLSGSRSLHGSVHHTETTGVSDTSKISPAVQKCSKTTCLEIASITKRSGSLEDKMRNFECR